MGNKQKILVIIPAYNEEGSVGEVVHLFFFQNMCFTRGEESVRL
jgi:glycosyltransferase involved in cell wall biosynthesis